LGKKGGEGELAGFLEALRERGVDVGAMRCSETDPFQGRMTPIALVIHKVRSRQLGEDGGAAVVSLLRRFGHDPNELSQHDRSLPAVLCCYFGLPKILKALLFEHEEGGGSPPARVDARAGDR
jgi:hypothetical protein